MSVSSPPRALVSTIEPIDGGVPTMTRCLAALLQEVGIEPVFAWYAPWSKYPSLSTPLPALLRGGRPCQRRQEAYGGHEAHGLGSWLPELEFTHYLPRRAWRELIASCQLHLSVTGNALSALPFAQLGLPFLAWVATPWEADRSDRVRAFSLPRRLLDGQLNSRVLRRLERRVLRAPAGRVLALSPYTASALATLAGRPMEGVLLMPIDPAVFHPDPSAVVPWRLGFAGRYGDPRKHIDLLLQAIQRLAEQGAPVELHLAGEADRAMLQPRLRQLQIPSRVICHGPLDPPTLAPLLRSLDLFVVPSHQEGLCIAALEAMACGVPVVSTRCGGPEHFVIPGRTGDLVARDPQALAEAIAAIAADRAQRQHLAAGALAWVAEQASPTAARTIVRRQIRQLWPGCPLPVEEGS
jgi:glycosyltransferase involved in cell wall biosynthesis